MTRSPDWARIWTTRIQDGASSCGRTSATTPCGSAGCARTTSSSDAGRGGPDLEYYEELGRRGFQLAADHRLAEEHGLATLYATAAERFGILRSALNVVSDSLFFPNVQTPERLMRQVRDEARWRLMM